MSSPVYFPPLFAAGTLRSAWPRGRESHREAAVSGHRSTWPRRNTDTPQSATPYPTGRGRARLLVSRETTGIPSIPATVGTDVPEQSTTHRLMTTNSALRNPPLRFLKR